MTTISSLKCGLFALAAGLLATPASAQLIAHTITSSQEGWYSDGGEVSPNLGSLEEPRYSYLTGNFDGQNFRNFFVFDRSSLTNAEVLTATLDIYLPGQAGFSYLSADPSDLGAVFSLYQFSGDLASLRNGSDAAGSYAALASASPLFGSVTVSESTNAGVLLSIELNSLFLDFLNGTAGEFALAGSLANADASPLSEELMFLNSESAQLPQLRLEFVAVPEPSTYGLIGAAALGLLVWRRRVTKAVREV